MDLANNVAGKITGLAFWYSTFYGIWAFFTHFFIDKDMARLQGLLLFLWVPAVIIIFAVPVFFVVMCYYNIVKLALYILTRIILIVLSYFDIEDDGVIGETLGEIAGGW
jgi:hypothetical protein